MRCVSDKLLASMHRTQVGGVVERQRWCVSAANISSPDLLADRRESKKVECIHIEVAVVF